VVGGNANGSCHTGSIRVRQTGWLATWRQVAWHGAAARGSMAQHPHRHACTHQAILLDAPVAQQQQLRALLVGHYGVHLQRRGRRAGQMGGSQAQ
jgi:hypothetical protein